MSKFGPSCYQVLEVLNVVYLFPIVRLNILASALDADLLLAKVVNIVFFKQRTVGEIPTVDFINNLSNSQDYKPVLTESI